MRKALPAVLVAEDNAPEIAWVRQAFEHNKLRNKLTFVHDGAQLLDRLEQAQRAGQTLPGLVLIDLQRRMADGQRALRSIRADPDLCHLPVVMLASQPADADIRACYNAGANSCISRPSRPEDLFDLISDIDRYWLKLVTLPE